MRRLRWMLHRGAISGIGWMEVPSIHPYIGTSFRCYQTRAHSNCTLYTHKNESIELHPFLDGQTRGKVEGRWVQTEGWPNISSILYLLPAAAEPISGFVRNTFGHHKSLPPILELDITPKGELLEDKFVSFPPLCRLGSQIASHLFDFNPAGQWNSLVQFFNRFFPS